MPLTPAQLAVLKADIAASPDVRDLPNDDDSNFAIAVLYSQPVSPVFWVWRTDVTRSNIYNDLSPDSTSWDWTVYKGQSVPEQGAWTQMFMGDKADFSKANLRAGIAKIFGAGNVNNAHCLAMGRRAARRIEKLLSTGTGSAASPAIMAAEGTISGSQISDARNS